MKRYAALLAILLVAIPVAAMAGANVGATLLASTGVWSKTTACSTLQVTACSELTPTNQTEVGANNYIAIYVGREPAPMTIQGIDFGITYGFAIAVVSWNKCGDLDVPTDGTTAPAFPGFTGSGDSLVWVTPQITNVLLVGWFRVTTYTGYGPMVFCVGPHPLYGVAQLVDDQGNYDLLRGPACGSWDGTPETNPDCAPNAVQNSTWGNIKNLYQN